MRSIILTNGKEIEARQNRAKGTETGDVAKTAVRDLGLFHSSIFYKNSQVKIHFQ
jgi:hypothetical protein